MLPLQGVWVQSLVEELRSYSLFSAAPPPQNIYIIKINIVGGRQSKSKGLEAPVNMATVQLVD